jgi:uncharacterized membrane protein
MYSTAKTKHEDGGSHLRKAKEEDMSGGTAFLLIFTSFLVIAAWLAFLSSASGAAIVYILNNKPKA